MIIIQPDDIQIHLELPPVGFDWDLVALDSEWFNQDVDHLHRPHGKFGCLACTSDGENVYMIFNPNQIQQFFDNIDDTTQVFCNAQYDIRQLRAYANLPDRKKLWDVQLVEQIMFAGKYDKFALNDLARRWCDIYMDKSVRDEFSDAEQTTMTDEQIFYCAVDVIATWQVAKAQMAVIDEDDLGIWNNVEKPFLYTLLSSKGIMFDGVKWMERANRDRALAVELDAALPFNPRSPKQVKEWLLTKKIKTDSTDEKHLAEILEKHPELTEIEQTLTARGLSKAAGTYGQGWVDELEEDGRVYPQWRQILETGRSSAGGRVAIQTMPHVKEYRECVVASPGHTLVINDYSAQEPRILAALTQDPTLIKIFKSGKDIYISIGFEVFGEVFDKKDPRRQAMKSIILGVSYGMSASGLAAKLEISVEEAEGMLAIFFKKFPLVKKWVDECNVWKPYTTSILGRKFWGNQYTNSWSRNYQNFPCQGSAADCTKISASKIVRRLGYNPLTIYLHDEIVCDVPNEDLERATKIISDTMSEVAEWQVNGMFICPVETFIGQTWAAK